MANVEVNFTDGETVIVAIGFKTPPAIDLVLRAWALLYQREILDWKPTMAAAEYWYDTKTKRINRYDLRGYHDELVDLLPIAALKKKLGEQPRPAERTGCR